MCVFPGAVLTSEDHHQNDGQINEEELEVSQITQDLQRKNKPNVTLSCLRTVASELWLRHIPERVGRWRPLTVGQEEGRATEHRTKTTRAQKE